MRPTPETRTDTCPDVHPVPPNPPVAPHEPPRGLRLFLRELALGLLDLFYPPRHP